MDEEKVVALVTHVKRKLKITWDDIDTNAQVRDIVELAIPILNHKIGVASFDYIVPGQEKNLFLNYCMYEWWNRANEFDSNYSNELIQLRIKYEVLQYEESE